VSCSNSKRDNFQAQLILTISTIGQFIDPTWKIAQHKHKILLKYMKISKKINLVKPKITIAGITTKTESSLPSSS